MARRRTELEQVKSGFRIAGWIIFSVLFAIALGKAFQFALGRDDNPSLLHRLLGLVLVIVLSGVLYRTVKTWAKWMAGFIALSTFKVIGGLITGREYSWPHRPVPRQLTLGMLVWVLTSSYLLFYVHRRKLKTWERVGAVAVPLSICVYLATGAAEADAKLVLVGPVILFLSLIPRLLGSWKKAHSAPDQVSPSTVDGIQ